MKVALKYGLSSLSLDIDDSIARVTLLQTGRIAASSDEDLIRSALSEPIDSLALSDLVAPGQRVVVVTSDITRPCPSDRLLPHVLDAINRGGVRDQDVLVVFGLGTHRPHSRQERRLLAGDGVIRRVQCVDSDPTDTRLVGLTSRGTPVSVFRPVCEADVRVCLGAIEYHYFAGYSGGVKALVPGVCSADTIQHNHRMMTLPGATAGNLAGNPVRDDIDEAGKLVGADFILNVILDGDKRVVGVVAGHPRAAHRAGCALLDGFGRASIERLADVAIVSAGGHPKDLNLYQAQKALDNARHIVRRGGIVVLLAECGEGLGNSAFEDWMREPGGPDAIVARIQREFVLGGHKAAAVAMAMQQAAIYLVSALPADLARSIGFHPFDSLREALNCALAQVGSGSTVAVMPEGGSVLPYVEATAESM